MFVNFFLIYFKKKIKYGGGSGSCNHTSNKFDYWEFSRLLPCF